MNSKKIPALLLIIVVIFALCACGSSTGGAENSNAEQTTYAVKVVDELGNPMRNVTVQLCKDSCFPAVTNGEGIAQFSVAKDTYKVSVISVPEGYQADAAEFHFEDGATELTITLRPAAWAAS